VYSIYYGQNWTAPDVNLLSTFAAGLGGSTWMGMTTYQAAMSTSFRFADSSNSTYKKEGGGPLESSDILAIVRQAIKYGLPGAPSALYLVLTSQEVLVRDFCDKFCGWHSFAPFANGSQDTLKYGFVGNAAQCPDACAAQSVSPNGNVGVDGMASVIAHEITEMVSDPELSAWFDSFGDENADKCAWTFGNVSTLDNGAAYNVDLGDHKRWLLQRKIVIRSTE